MKTITITLDGDKVTTRTSEPMKIPDITHLVLSGMLSVYNNTIETAPLTIDKEVLTQELFNMFNESASTLLAQLAPDIDLRPDITAEAILELENQKLNKQKEA